MALQAHIGACESCQEVQWLSEVAIRPSTASLKAKFFEEMAQAGHASH